MLPDDPTASEVYQGLLIKLRDAGADPIAQEIERTVARGVVLTGNETDPKKISSTYRKMNDTECLAIGLEFFVTALEVPCMLHICRQDIRNDLIEWRLERPGSEREEVALGDAGGVDHGTLKDRLKRVVEIAQELRIDFPEVA